MNSNDRMPVSTGMKLVALLLMVGGAVGIAVAVWLDIKLVTNSQVSPFSATTAIIGVFILVYGWAAWTGRDLWKGRRRALTFAQILFGMQIPAFTIPGISYEFHTGFTLLITILSGPRIHFNFNIGSSFAFYVSSQVHGVAIGINLFALAVLVYLIQKSQKRVVSPSLLVPTYPAVEATGAAVDAGSSNEQNPQAY